MEYQTTVDEERITKWAERFRERPDCVLFIENFFYTCQHCSLQGNMINYSRDIKTQKRIDPSWRDFEAQLMHAFFDITGATMYLN